MVWSVRMGVSVLKLKKNLSAFALQHTKEHTVKRVCFKLLDSL